VCCSVLQCAAGRLLGSSAEEGKARGDRYVRCIVLQLVAACCSLLQLVVLCCRSVESSDEEGKARADKYVCCSVLQCVAVY